MSQYLEAKDKYIQPGNNKNFLVKKVIKHWNRFSGKPGGGGQSHLEIFR